MKMKSQSQHPPGPWTVDRINAGFYDITSEPRGEKWSAVCTVKSNGLGQRPVAADECESNARLIAAAPDLLEAFQAALRRHDGLRKTKQPWRLKQTCICSRTSRNT